MAVEKFFARNHFGIGKKTTGISIYFRWNYGLNPDAGDDKLNFSSWYYNKGERMLRRILFFDKWLTVNFDHLSTNTNENIQFTNGTS